MPVSPKHHAGSDGERSVAPGKQKALLSAVTAVLFSPEDDRQRLHRQSRALGTAGVLVSLCLYRVLLLVPSGDVTDR